MKVISIKRMVLSLILTLGSVITLPAYAWPDTDEMNMCGAAVKNVRAYANDFRGWAAHDVYVSHRGKNYYYSTNCPQSKATKNYKGKNWAPGAKMHAKHKARKMHGYKHHMKHKGHNPNHKNHADCIRTDKLNNSGATVKKVTHRKQFHHSYKRHSQKMDHDFYRQAQAVLNMSMVKRKYTVHNPNHKNHADCVRTDGLNNSGAVVRVVHKKHH